jgi:hypothetical protein
MHAMTRSLAVVAAGALAFLIWTFASRKWSGKPAAERPAAVYQDVLGIDRLTSVTILHFYASPGTLVDGDKALLCYGVAKARAVRLEPPAEALAPSLNRCIQVAPEQDTQYTLIAEGADGRTVSESLTIQVTADPLRAPKVLYFVSAKKDTVYSLCFGVENAVRVSVDPPVIPPMEGAPRGCFYVAPKQTTTYTLMVNGRHGTVARRQITVSVR